MPIHIVPHEPAWSDAVLAFNLRMREGGSKYGFYVNPDPPWIPKRHDAQPVWREYWLAVEDGREVRGAYALKPQAWWIRGRTEMVTDWQGPFSEGVVSNRYGALGLRMLRDMVSRRPLLYSWGHGGDDGALVPLLRRVQWKLHSTPFLFRVCDPFRFARRNAYLRTDAKRRLALDALAFTGLATIGGHAVHAALRVRSGKRFRAEVEVVREHGPWADETWERARGDYAALAVRDARAMNVLVPPEGAHYEWSDQIRLRVTDRGRDVGWAIVCHRELEGHHRFGDLHVGTLVDYFGAPADAAEIVHAAFDFLRARKVDVVIANQSDPRWVRAFEDAGFLRVEDRRLFCAAPPLAELLEPWEETMQRLFLTNLDGHGPMGL
jgi:hypothetical protein